jgi:Papain family cysteine protease
MVKGRIIRDPSDLRDLLYRPTLSLLPETFLCAAVNPTSSVFDPDRAVRDQGERPSCIGEALAALIDIQRIETYQKAHALHAAGIGPEFSLENLRKQVQPASAAMLHAMAMEVEGLELGQEAKDVYSLRSGLKGFYNTGVSTEDLWQRKAIESVGTNFDACTTEIMTQARNVTLGAYYRVRSFINDYHAALVEAGALYVAAKLHRGWDNPAKGVIDPKATEGVLRADGHAFVIVGYTRTGFLVLNSWGENWGRYRLDDTELPGIALWTYEDWANNVLDAWVLRLAAPTPESFRYAVGQHGAAIYGGAQPAIEARSVRRLEVLGHYVHLDDGRCVPTGNYPSSRKSLDTTLEHLARKSTEDISDIRLTIHGDITPTSDLMARVADGLPADRRQATCGISLIWVNDLLAGAADALKPLFDSALAVAQGNRDDADRRIEIVTRPVGRALWRDAKRAAHVAADPHSGDATYLLNEIVRMCAKTGKRLHIVCEAAGALLLSRLLETQNAAPAERETLTWVLASLTLVSPLIRQDEFNANIGPFLERWHANSGKRAFILKPNLQFDDRLCVGAYSRSWSDLVSMAFEEEKILLVGAHDFRGDLLGDPGRESLRPPNRPSGDLGAADVLQHAGVHQHVATQIRPGSAPPPPL